MVVQNSLLGQTEDGIAIPYILDGAEIADMATTSLGETLDSLAGVTTADYGSAVGRPIIRGLSGLRVKVTTMVL